jgi:signal transduction histidine kinase/CheY-like chemotaxis protein
MILMVCASWMALMFYSCQSLTQSTDTSITNHTREMTMIIIVSVILLLLIALAFGWQLVGTMKQNKLRQKTLEISQESTAVLIKETPNIALMFDDQLNLIDCNDITPSLLGFADKAETLREFHTALKQYMQPYRTNGEPSVPIETRLEIAIRDGFHRSESNLIVNGKKLVLDMSYRRIPYRDSFALIGYGNDITTLREEQQKRQKLTDTFGLSGAYIWELDAMKKYYQMVVTSMDWLGVTQNFSEGYVYELIPQMCVPEDVEKLFAAVSAYLHGDGEGTFSCIVRFHNFVTGVPTWVRLVGYADEKNEDGSIRKLTGTLINIDEQMLEIKQRNDELERQQLLFQNVFSVMDAAVILLPHEKPVANDKFGVIMPGWEKVFLHQLTPDDLFDYFASLTHNPEDHVATIYRLRETKESQETLWYFKTGRIYSCKGFLVPLTENGKEFAELWTLRDVTQIENERKIYSSIFEAMDPAVLLIPGAPISNKGYEELLPGWKDVYPIGGTDFDDAKIFWDQYVYNSESILEPIQRLRVTHKRQEAAWHFRDGRRFTHVGLSIDMGNDTFAELWYLRDITELESTKQLFDEIFALMDPAVAILTDGKVFANAAYSEVFHDWENIYNGSLVDPTKTFDILKVYWDSMITNTDEHIEVVKQLRETHETVQSIWHFRDGRECMHKGYWISMGDVKGELWVMTDVTMLYDAMRRANEASLAKSMFLSSMSHEIRTPMNAIIGMTSLARRSHDLTRIQRYLEKTEEAGHRLMTLINDILDMSKIESGKLQIVESEFDYVKMCENAVNVLVDKALEKRIDLKTIYHGKFSHLVWTDELRVSQVIVNLLSNAVKFTPEGGSVLLTTEVIENRLLRVSCQDTGIGIRPEAMPKLFHSFEQANKTITREFGGTGLGLALCKQIVELMGGSIWVESEEGKGSIFTFEVPFEWRGSLRAAISLGDVLTNVKILVVDDEPDILEYFSDLLKSYYIKADTAESGMKALELARQAKESDEPYRIAFIDWKMPMLSGAETAKQLRQIIPDCKIIIISAYCWNEIKESFDGDGQLYAVDFMPKPIPPSDIYNRIINLLDIQVSNEHVVDLSGKQILLVEDVELNRLLVVDLLEDSGCIIEEAENGQIAVDMVRAKHYDLILMDMQMPVMDGLTATRIIRTFDETTPIVAMTANAFREDAQACLDAGMSAHISKPLDNDVFMRTLKEYLQ